MPGSLHTTIRNNMLDQITAFIGNAAKLRLYTAGYAVLLSEHVCGTPFAPAAALGVLTRNPIANGVALATGNVAAARVYKADGTTIALWNLTAGDQGSAAQVKIAQVGTLVTIDQTIIIDTGTMTAGNP